MKEIVKHTSLILTANMSSRKNKNLKKIRPQNCVGANMLIVSVSGINWDSCILRNKTFLFVRANTNRLQVCRVRHQPVETCAASNPLIN